MEIQNQIYFLLRCFGFWVYLTYQGGAEERQEQLLAGSVSSPLGGTPLTCLALWDSSPPSAWHTQASYPLQCTATAYVSLTFGYTALLYVIALVYHAIPKHMMQLSAQCSTLLGPQCIPSQGLPFWLYIIKILHWKVHGISNQFVCSSGYCCFVSCIASSRCSGLWILCIAEQHQSIVLHWSALQWSIRAVWIKAAHLTPSYTKADMVTQLLLFTMNIILILRRFKVTNRRGKSLAFDANSQFLTLSVCITSLQASQLR